MKAFIDGPWFFIIGLVILTLLYFALFCALL